MIFLSEIRLKRICDSLINYLVEDLKQSIQNNIENESHLYLLFHQDANDTTSSVNYKEAKEIFLREESNPRYLKISPMFDRRRASLPTIHIVIPQDSENFNQIGDIEGDLYIYEEEDKITEAIERGFITQFNLITTSDNINEVLFITYVMRALLIGAIPQLAAIGFINPQFNTQDLNINPELFPANVYMKGISMTATYTESVPQIGKEKQINNYDFFARNTTEENM